jgi:hypothetical protein
MIFLIKNFFLNNGLCNLKNRMLRRIYIIIKILKMIKLIIFFLNDFYINEDFTTSNIGPNPNNNNNNMGPNIPPHIQ